MDGLDIAAIIILAFNVFVCCPYTIHSLWNFYRLSQQSEVSPIISRRNSPLIYGINFLIITANLTERVFMLSAQVWQIIDVPVWAVGLFLASTWWAAMSLFAVRCYHLYFQQRYNMAVADALWKKDINPNVRNWYIANKHTYGNPVYLMGIAFWPYLLCVTADVLAAIFMHQGLLFDLVKFSVASIPLTVAICIFYQARKLNDVHKIRNEILYQFIILLSSLTVYTISFLVCHYFVEHTRFAQRVEWLSYLVVTDGVSFALALFPTFYAVRLVKAGQTAPSKLHALSVTSFSPSVESNMKSPAPLPTHSLLHVLSVKEPFKLFMQHLVKEFSAENLLFLVELTQIKAHFQQENGGVVRLFKDTQSVLCSVNSVETPALITPAPEADDKKVDQAAEEDGGANEIEMQAATHSVAIRFEPVSSCVIKRDNALCQVVDFNLKLSNDVIGDDTIFTYLFDQTGGIITPLYLPASLPRTIALSDDYPTLFSRQKFLYEKYIRTNSDYEINLPYSTHDALEKYFLNTAFEKDYKCFNILDEPALEIVLLLHDAFSRFKTTPEYARIVSKLDAAKSMSMGELTSRAKIKQAPILRNATSYSKLQDEYI